MSELKQELMKDMAWLKGLLNNIPLLKWVRKYTADNLLADNNLAEKWSIRTTDESISVSDSTLTKIMVTNSRYAGTEHSRYNLKHLAEIIKTLGDEGELIISKEGLSEMFCQIKTNVVVVCPLPTTDKKEK